MSDEIARVKRDSKQAAREGQQDNPGINTMIGLGDVESLLDKALMDTFPASDTPCQVQPGRQGPTGDPDAEP